MAGLSSGDGLELHLQDTKIPGYLEWVSLSYAEIANSPADLETMVKRDTKHAEEEVRGVIEAVCRQGLLDELSKPTELARTELTIARSRVGIGTPQLVDGLTESDLEVTYRVLDTVRTEAEAPIAYR